MNKSVDTKSIRSFANNEKGSIAVLSAITLAVIVGVAGLAVDYGRSVSAKSALQSAADAAALKASALYSRGESQYEEVATRIFNANMVGKDDVRVKSISIKKNGANKIEVAVSAELPAYLIAVVGV
ncbi:MAG: hypothetical protein KDK27_20200, partial [Leptospiraceae bacterium]|nr:hypothetical protein [Leptospiraceae bacterium]